MTLRKGDVLREFLLPWGQLQREVFDRYRGKARVTYQEVLFCCCLCDRREWIPHGFSGYEGWKACSYWPTWTSSTAPRTLTFPASWTKTLRVTLRSQARAIVESVAARMERRT